MLLSSPVMAEELPPVSQGPAAFASSMPDGLSPADEKAARSYTKVASRSQEVQLGKALELQP